MPSLTILPPAGLGLSALLLVSSPGPAEENPAPRRPPARVYTNEDLDRVHAFREETGVRSVPAAGAAAPDSSGSGPGAPRAGRRAAAKSEDGRPRTRGEAYWRAEARRVRDRVAALAAQADELRARLAAEEDERQHFARTSRPSRSRAGLSGGVDPVGQARLAAIGRRMRALEDDLAERARRDGALPGWLR